MIKYRSQWHLFVFLFVGLSCSIFTFTTITSSQADTTGPINWFTTSTISTENSPGWGRMIPWDMQGDNLVTYTEYPANGSPIVEIARSNPTNPGYVIIGSIPSPSGHIQEQSQMVQLPNGDILLVMRNHQTDLNWFGLPVVKSTDGGYTWNYVSQLDTNPHSNGRVNRGLWEPFLSVLPDGCVAGFYANEKHADDNPSYSQIISERISCDEGQTWGPEIYAAALPGIARPGMPGFARMANGQYILVFEDCVDDNCNVHYKISNDGVTWSAGLGTAIPDQVTGPFVTVLSSGRILVSSGQTNQISISDDNAHTWYLNNPPAFQGATNTWPAIYQSGYKHGNEIGVIVNMNGAIDLRFGNYSTTTTPTPTRGSTPTPTPTPTLVPQGVCHITYTVQNQWTGGFTGAVTITNTGMNTINGWNLQFSFAAGQQVQSAWNTTFSQQGSQVTAKDAGYNASIAPGGSTSFGFNGSWNVSNLAPSSFTLNGTACN